MEAEELGFDNALEGVGRVKAVPVEEGMGVSGFEKHLGVKVMARKE